MLRPAVLEPDLHLREDTQVRHWQRLARNTVSSARGRLGLGDWCWSGSLLQVCEGVCQVLFARCPIGDLLVFADDRIIFPSVVCRNLKLLSLLAVIMATGVTISSLIKKKHAAGVARTRLRWSREPADLLGVARPRVTP